MKVNRNDLVALYSYLGADRAEVWDDATLLGKVNKPGHLEVMRDNQDVTDLKLAGLYNNVTKAVDGGEPIELEGKEPKAKPAKSKPTTKVNEAPKATKTAAKPSKNGKPAADHRGPGVIDAMIEVLRKGTEKKPKSKKDVLAELVKKFPDRTGESMWNTTSSYIPNRIYIERGIRVSHDGHKGFWIRPDADVGRPSTKEAEKLKAEFARKPKADPPKAKAPVKAAAKPTNGAAKIAAAKKNGRPDGDKKKAKKKAAVK